MRIFTFLLFFLFSTQSLAQNFYGVADFSKRNGYPRDGAIAIWENIDPGTTGDMLQGIGDFESWGGASGGCANCPVGITCACGATATLDIEQSVIYKNNSAIKMTSGAAGGPNFLINPTFQNNKIYELTFMGKGVAGGEAFYVTMARTNNPVYYNSATDAWQVGGISSTFAMATTWTRYVIYIKTDATSMAGQYIRFVWNANNQTYYFDDIQIREIKDSSSTSQPGGYKLSQVVTSDPVYGDNDKDMTVVDGQKDKRGIYFGGTDDYMRLTTDIPALHGGITGNVSGCIEFKNETSVVNGMFMGYECCGGGYAWILYNSPPNFSFWMSNTGSAADISTLGVNNPTILAQNSGCFTYEGIAHLSSKIRLYLNHQIVGTNNVARYPIYSAPGAGFAIGDVYDNLQSNINAQISKIAIYDRVLTAKDAANWVSPYYFGHKETEGFYSSYCAQTGAHATCGFEKCIDAPDTRCMADTDWMPIFGSYIERWPNNSFETSGSSDPDYVPSSHAVTKTVGDGTSLVSAYRVSPQHGNVAVRVRLTGTTSAAIIQESVCQTTGIGSDIYTYVREKTRSGNVNTAIQILEYDTGSCGTLLATTNIATATGEVNRWVGGKFAAASWNGSTSSYLIQIVETGDNGIDVTFDSASLKVAKYFTPWVHNSGAGTTTVSIKDQRLHNPLADVRNKSNGRYAYQDGFCTGQWIWTDYDGSQFVAPHKMISYIPATAGSNNSMYWQLETGNYVALYLYDGAGVVSVYYLVSDATNWTGGDSHYIEICNSNTGTLRGRWYNRFNNTWYNLAAAGVGTKIFNGMNSTIYIGSPSNALDGYLGNFYIGPYQNAYPMYGFENRPVQNPH